jgi:hypothetical protein
MRKGIYMPAPKSPKVFLSYSWDDDTHKKWVKDLAVRLRGDGVDVTLDRWGVAPGGQIPEYMERSVRENDFVLIVCTPKYKSRSDNRTGGVGYEGDIITGEVFVQGNDQKFIPLLRGNEWVSSAPSWLLGKYYIDFRGEPYSEDSYHELLDYLFDQREKAPPLGIPKSGIQKPNNIVIRYAEGDKDFALWLSLQLINQSYPVWCDLLNPEPGEYTRAVGENLVKNKAVKYLFVLSSLSNGDSELLKDLRFAYEIMQSKKLVGFVIPVQLADVPDDERTILLQGTSPIDFSQGWSVGLNDLLKYLEKSGVAKDEEFTPSKTNDLWRLQFNADKGLKYESEELLSNWFPIRLPEILYFHELKRTGIGLLEIQKENLPFPAIQHNIYIITFAKAQDFSEKLGNNISIKCTVEIKIQDFLEGNYDQKLAKEDLAWNFVVELLNDAWSRFFLQTKLKKHILANNRLSFYFPAGFSDKGDNKAFFQGIDGRRTWRSLAGKHKSNFWHFGIQGRAKLYPEPVFIVKPHGLASSDGINIWESKERLHTIRRRWFKNWWNPEWRDRLLAAMAYFSGEKEFFKIYLGTDVFISVSSSPLVFLSPVKYINSRDALVETEVENESLSDDEEFDEEFDDFSEEHDL